MNEVRVDWFDLYNLQLLCNIVSYTLLLCGGYCMLHCCVMRGNRTILVRMKEVNEGFGVCKLLIFSKKRYLSHNYHHNHNQLVVKAIVFIEGLGCLVE